MIARGLCSQLAKPTSSPLLSPNMWHAQRINPKPGAGDRPQVCSLGINDLSAFTFTEITARTTHKDARGHSIGARYMEAFSYFRSGKKGVVLPTHFRAA